MKGPNVLTLLYLNFEGVEITMAKESPNLRGKMNHRLKSWTFELVPVHWVPAEGDRCLGRGRLCKASVADGPQKLLQLLGSHHYWSLLQSRAETILCCCLQLEKRFSVFHCKQRMDASGDGYFKDLKIAQRVCILKHPWVPYFHGWVCMFLCMPEK